MFVEGDYRPQEKEATFDAGLPGKSGEQGSGKGQPFHYFLPTLERRVREHVTQSDLESTVLDMSAEIHQIWTETQGDGNEEAKDTAFRLLWAYDALTFYYYSFPAWQDQMTREYNKYQAENREQGNVLRGVEIFAGEEKQTLIWMLDTVGVPHNLGTGDICIPFASLEQQMRHASAQRMEQVNAEPTPIYFDHEIRTGVTDLMEQWKQTGEDSE